MPDVKRLRGVVFAALLVLYPLGVYFGLQYLQPRVFGGLLIALFALRLFAARGKLGAAARYQWYPMILMGCGCALAAIVFNNADSLRLLPVATNAICLVSFGYTLWRPPSMIERFARGFDSQLDARGVAYTRRVTQVWCGFFLANGLIALYTALATSLAVWTLYNGLLAYLLMASLLAGEYLVRRRVRAAVR